VRAFLLGFASVLTLGQDGWSQETTADRTVGKLIRCDRRMWNAGVADVTPAVGNHERRLDGIGGRHVIVATIFQASVRSCYTSFRTIGLELERCDPLESLHVDKILHLLALRGAVRTPKHTIKSHLVVQLGMPKPGAHNWVLLPGPSSCVRWKHHIILIGAPYQHQSIRSRLAL
jgi:hypothetical protein